jgi:hypothetical protein
MAQVSAAKPRERVASISAEIRFGAAFLELDFEGSQMVFCPAELGGDASK